MNIRFPLIAAAIAGLSVVASALTLDPSSAPRSGLLRIRGSGFGTGGIVRIGAHIFPIARWTGALIECYVPANAPTGVQLLQVIPNTGSALRRLTGRLTVLPQEPPTGRLSWRIKLADQYVGARPAIGPDGTVYALGNYGRVYAVTMQGAIKWVAPVNAAGTIDVLPNGTVIVGGGGGEQALSPTSGQRIWTYALSTPLLCGPSVGPDGNIYASDDSRWSTNVIGAFVLNPSGQKLWSGGVFYRDGGGWTPQEVQFGGGNAYFWSDYSPVTPGTLGGLNAMFLGGGLRWRAEDGVGIMPGSAPSGGVAFFRPSSIEMWTPAGAPVWSQNLNQFGGQPKGEAVVGSDGRTYFLTSNARLNVISPTGQVLFSKVLGGLLSDQVVLQDGNLVVLEKQPNFGVPSEVQGFDKSLNMLWSQQLPMDLGMAITVWEKMVFSATGQQVYFGTAGPTTAPGEAHCYLYGLNAQ